MAIYDQKQQAIAERIDPETILMNWRDWKWQLQHVVKDLDTFERLMEIRLAINPCC